MNRAHMIASSSTTPVFAEPRNSFYNGPHMPHSGPPFPLQNPYDHHHHNQHHQQPHPQQLQQPPQHHHQHQQQYQQPQPPQTPTAATTTNVVDSAATSKYYRPYFTPSEIEYLSEKQRGKQTVTQEDKARQSACTFIESIGARVGFPRRTTATAQLLYHRFHLFYPRKEFSYHEVALATLYVSTKIHDTLKKPRDLLSASYAIRFPELSAKSKQPGGDIDIEQVDPQLVENDRQRLLTIERLVLETICFNFKARMAFPYVFKLGKQLYNLDHRMRTANANPNNDPTMMMMEDQDPPLPAVDDANVDVNVNGAGSSSPSSSSAPPPPSPTPEILLQLAWRLSIDSYRTLLPLIYPPHTIALGCIYTAAHLQTFERTSSTTTTSSDDLVSVFIPAHQQVLEQFSQWPQDQYYTRPEDLEDIAHTLLDLLIQYSQNPSANTSPSTPSSPSPHQSSSLSSSSATTPRDRSSFGGGGGGSSGGLLSQSISNSYSQQQQVYRPDQLIRLKIALRQMEHASTRVRKPFGVAGSSSSGGGGPGSGSGSGDPSEGYELKAVLGQSEGTTTRFLFFPPGTEG